MKVLLKFKGEDYEVNDISKAMTVRKFRTEVKNVTGVEQKLQNLYFGGKVLHDDCDLCDYKIEGGYTIILQQRQPLAEKSEWKNESEVTPKENREVAKPIEKEKPTEEEKSVEEPTEEKSLSPAEEREKLKAMGLSEDELKDLGLGPEVATEKSTEVKPEEPCKKCKSNPEKNCKECGCMECGGKTPAEELLFCEECEFLIHFQCLPEPIASLDELPGGKDADFYCPHCKNDESEIVREGEMVRYGKSRAKMPSRVKMSKRDWGKGMACSGRTKTCTIVGPEHAGPIPGIDCGMHWQYRMQCAEAGVHRPPVSGIAGSEKVGGCTSIVLGGGYEDDEDSGESFTYTGSGGRDLSGNKRTAEQSSDQELTKSNKAMAISCAAKFNSKDGADAGDKWRDGRPIRVVRGWKGRKHSTYAPDEGCRYDGIYKLAKYWPQKGRAGYIVWRFLFKRDDPSPAPWDPTAIKYEMIRKEEEDKTELKGQKRKIANEKENTEDSEAMKNRVEVVYEITPGLLALAEADEKNKEKWDEIIAFKARKDKWVEKVKEQFDCFACYEVLFKPVTLPCSHSACLSCLKKCVAESHLECWLCRDKFEGIKDELEEYVNEECYKALQVILPGYDYARLESEKKMKGKKGGNANPVRKSNRQNDEAESEVSTSEVEQSSTTAIESGTSTIPAPTPTPKGAAPRTASTRPARKSKNDISYNEDLSERQFLAKLKAGENQEPKSKAGPKSKKIKAEQKTEEVNGTSDIKEIKTEIKTQIETENSSASGSSKAGPKSKKRKAEEEVEELEKEIKTENSASASSKTGPKSKKRKVEPETEVKKEIEYESSDDDTAVEIPKKKSKPGPKSKKQKADKEVIDTSSDIEEIKSPKAGPSGLSAKKEEKRKCCKSTLEPKSKKEKDGSDKKISEFFKKKPGPKSKKTTVSDEDSD